MTMKKKKTKGYRGGGKVKKMSKGGAAGGKMRRMSKGGAAGGKIVSKMNMGGAGMTMAQLRSAAAAKGMTLSPNKKMAKGGAAKKKK